MSEAALHTADAKPEFSRGAVIWFAVLAIAVALVVLRGDLPWMSDYPDSLIIPVKDAIAWAMAWAKSNLLWFTRSITAVIDVPLRFAFGLFAKGFKVGTGETAFVVPRLSWLGVCLVMGWLGYLYGGLRLAALCGLGFLALAVFKLWDNSMLTLALIVICVPFCVVSGLLAGIWAYYSPRAERLLITPAPAAPSSNTLIPARLALSAIVRYKVMCRSNGSAMAWVNSERSSSQGSSAE